MFLKLKVQFFSILQAWVHKKSQTQEAIQHQKQKSTEDNVGMFRGQVWVHRGTSRGSRERAEERQGRSM